MGTFWTKWDEDYGARARINARRLRLRYGEFLGGFPWEFQLTLTTDPERFARASEYRVSRETHRFCCELSYLSRFSVGWAYAVEGGGGPALHAHVLVMKANRRAMGAALLGWQVRNGFTHRRGVENGREAARYLCKSIGRNGEVVFSDSLIRFRQEGTYGVR